MKSKLLGLTAVAALAIGFASSGAQAQSAKFAASWDENPVYTFAVADNLDGAGEFDFNVNAETDMATIHIGASKSILISVSGQVGIGLLTYAKGKSAGGGVEGTSTAIAAAGVVLGLSLVDVDDETNVCTVVPGPVIFDGQLQALKVSAKSTEAAEDDPVAIEIGVGLLTAEASAHHFEFIGVECGQGTYRATAHFGLGALAAAYGQESLAGALVVLGNRIITLQDVRAVRGSILEDDDS